MSDNLYIDYKGISVKKELYSVIKHIEDVEKYREELGRLSSSWDIFALLGQLGDINIDVGKTKENFTNLTTTLLNQLSEQTIKKVTQEMNFKSQVAIDVVIRNLFERTADIGFLATDDDIRDFLNNYTSKYNSESIELKDQIKQRFKEYVAKYSVYFDIVLVNPKGHVLTRLNEDIDVDKVSDSFLQKVLNSTDEYVETYRYHQFLPQFPKTLVYSSKVTKTNNSNSEVIGALCLCFKFTDEMKGIFDNLIDKKNKECLTILDDEGCVIASSDQDHISVGSKLPIILNDEYKIISHAGRDYIAKTCKTNGYQGFMGLQWYGHIMIPLEYAFLSDENNQNSTNEKIIQAMMDNEQHFSKDLKDVFNKSRTIQDNLSRVIWNGNIAQCKLNSSNRGFSKSLLNEIGLTGIKANSSLSNLNQTILNSIIKDSEFLSSLAIDIMDRNLYERANDCRWWALTSYFRESFDEEQTLTSKKDEITAILKYINDLYTVYTNLIVYDNKGKIIAVSNSKEEHLVGKMLTQDWVEDSLRLKDTSKYCVSKFENTNLYEDRPTYIYCAGIKSLLHPNQIKGGIAIVFDSEPQFEAMLDETLPKDNKGNKLDGIFALFTSKDKKIISSTNKDLKINDYLNLEDDFFNLSNGGLKNKIIEYEGAYYSVSVRCSKGYREYKSSSDDYKNDLLCFVFIKIGDINEKLNYALLNNNQFTNNSHTQKNLGDNTVELATFNLGKKFLAVEANNVLESVSISELQESIEINGDNPFKGMVVYKEKLISVLDIRKFIKEDVDDEDLNSIILFEYDKDNKDHCIGIMVTSLETISVVEKNSIQHIENHFLGTGTLINSLVDINEGGVSRPAMVLDIKKIDENLTEK